LNDKLVGLPEVVQGGKRCSNKLLCGLGLAVSTGERPAADSVYSYNDQCLLG